ncbi:hypothetical protein O3P69_003258 [Scylla paramamosain]|uniref:Metalloendopeptidase n=1 Tax=Scylla paramamosain TaxID=85552 RepID=A0AAW0UK11_SCYPA
MGSCTWWLAIALCFSALAASKDEEAKDDDENEVTEDDEGDTELPSRDFMDTNPTEVEGEPIFEGDILLTQSQWREIRERKGLNGESSRWPEGSDGYPLVPYLFTDSRLDTDTIKKGMDHWMEHTCIKFEETTNTNQPHLQYIYGGGCYSYVGKLNRNGQPVSIGSGCNYLGIVAHEIGHAIGFYHEQSRPDRDDYVVINYENIQDNRESNFNKYSTSVINNQNILYDYSSDMHYGSTGFSINGKTTISTKDHLAQVLIGQRAGLSHRDKHLANIMYKCIDKWLAKCEESTDPCQNGGYYGEACKCVCPPGTSGSNCETETGGYYGQCVKWIQAPECHVPKLTFSAFELYGKNPYCSGNTCCYFDALEIRTDNLNYGEVFCGTDIAPGRSFTTTGQEMILYFRTRSNRYTGWSADLTFEKQEGCEEPQTTEASATEEGSTVSTTEAFSPQCTLEYYNGVYYWSSPDFGDENYPNSFTCGVTGNADPMAQKTVLERLEWALGRFHANMYAYIQDPELFLNKKWTRRAACYIRSLNAQETFFHHYSDQPHWDHVPAPPWIDKPWMITTSKLTTKKNHHSARKLANETHQALFVQDDDSRTYEMCFTDGSVDPITKRAAAAFVHKTEAAHFRLPEEKVEGGCQDT